VLDLDLIHELNANEDDPEALRKRYYLEEAIAKIRHKNDQNWSHIGHVDKAESNK